LHRDRRDLDTLPFLAIPQEYHKSIHSTRPLQSIFVDGINADYTEVA
jgi:transposase-like protein